VFFVIDITNLYYVCCAVKVSRMCVQCNMCCARFFDRPVVPLPPPPEAWQHHPPVEPPQWGRALPPDFPPPRFLPAPEVPLVSDLFLHIVTSCMEKLEMSGNMSSVRKMLGSFTVPIGWLPYFCSCFFFLHDHHLMLSVV